MCCIRIWWEKEQQPSQTDSNRTIGKLPVIFVLFFNKSMYLVSLSSCVIPLEIKHPGSPVVFFFFFSNTNFQVQVLGLIF